MSSVRRTRSGDGITKNRKIQKVSNPLIRRKSSLTLTKDSAARLTQQMNEVLTAIPDDPDAFEIFSKKPLATQVTTIELSKLAGGGQKGGGLSHAVRGFIVKYIEPAWNTAHTASVAGKNYVSNIAVNYMNQIQTLATGAGLSGPNAQQNLQSILYGLTVLAAAWNLGLIQMIPGAAFHFMNILGAMVTSLAAVPMNPMVQDILMKIAVFYTAYRYRDIPVGAYGVFSGATTPIFTAIYARGDQAFQEYFPHFGENMAAGAALQLQELKAALADKIQQSSDQLERVRAATQPAIDMIKGVGTVWRNYLNNSIQKLINGLAQAQSDMDAIREYYIFLENIGREAQEQGVEMPEETPAEIADLIPLEVNNDNIRNNIVTGAIALGTVISDENDIDANEAAELLLALGNIGGNGNVGAAAAAPNENIVSISGIGGKARRRRQRKTAKKSHKKKHTKKHKAHKRKTTKGKKSKRHTKRRSYKGGAHGINHY